MIPTYSRLRRAARNALGTVVAAAMFAMMVVTFVDVVGRYVFSRPIPGAYELMQILMGIMVAAAFPLVTATREHVSMDLFSEFFRGVAYRILIALISLFSTAVLAFLALRMWDQAVNLQHSRTATLYLDLPIAPVAYLLAALFGVAAMVQAALLIEDLRGTAQTGSKPPAEPRL